MRPHELIERAARRYGLTPADLRGARRTRHISHARQAAAWALRRATELSLMEIGALLGRDHSTIWYAVLEAESRRHRDGAYNRTLHELIDRPVPESLPLELLERGDSSVAAWLAECGL